MRDDVFRKCELTSTVLVATETTEPNDMATSVPNLPTPTPSNSTKRSSSKAAAKARTNRKGGMYPYASTKSHIIEIEI